MVLVPVSVFAETGGSLPSSTELWLQDGSRLHAQLRWPSGGLRPGEKLPVLLLLGGFEHAGEVLDLVKPQGRVLMASFDYPFSGSREFHFPETFLDASEFRRLTPRTIEGLRRLIDWLEQRPEVDSQRIGVIGASFASPFVVAVAAQDPRVKALVLVHAFGDPQGTLRHRLTQVFERKLGVLASALATPSAWLVDEFLGVPKPEDEAARLRAGQMALLIEAREDQWIPPESREVLWQGLQRSEAYQRGDIERLQRPGGHVMPGASALIQELMTISTDWLMKKSFLKKGFQVNPPARVTP